MEARSEKVSDVQARTGRPVHITNVSNGGATYTDVVHKQLPQVDLKTADLVIVESSNDLDSLIFKLLHS